MANVKEIEQYLHDLDNIKETGHFSNISVRDYTFYHKDMTVVDMVSKGREYIRQLLMIHKGVAENRPNDVTEALPLHIVINSRLSELEEENRLLKLIIENGLGPEDLENDCL